LRTLGELSALKDVLDWTGLDWIGGIIWTTKRSDDHQRQWIIRYRDKDHNLKGRALWIKGYMVLSEGIKDGLRSVLHAPDTAPCLYTINEHFACEWAFGLCSWAFNMIATVWCFEYKLRLGERYCGFRLQHLVA